MKAKIDSLEQAGDIHAKTMKAMHKCLAGDKDCGKYAVAHKLPFSKMYEKKRSFLQRMIDWLSSEQEGLVRTIGLDIDGADHTCRP